MDCYHFTHFYLCCGQSQSKLFPLLERHSHLSDPVCKVGIMLGSCCLNAHLLLGNNTLLTEFPFFGLKVEMKINKNEDTYAPCLSIAANSPT